MVLVLAKNNVANIVGTAGVPPTSLLTYLTGQAYLDSEGAPRDGRRACIVEPFTSATIVDSLKGLFMPQPEDQRAVRKGMMGTDSAGMRWKMDQNVVSQTFGSYARCNPVDQHCNVQRFANLWAGHRLQRSPSRLLVPLHRSRQGDVITIANVYAVNPQNRQPYGTNRLRNFVVDFGRDHQLGRLGFGYRLAPRSSPLASSRTATFRLLARALL